VTYLAKAALMALCLALLAGAGCTSTPVREGPEKLIVHVDGSMEFQNRLMSAEDVVIYPDGFGGERAAVRVRYEPVHPDFFRDTIVVERR